MAADSFTATNNPLAPPWAAVANFGAVESTGGEARKAGVGACAMVYSTSNELYSEVAMSDREGGGGADDNGAALLDPATGNGYIAVITGAVFLIRVAAGAYDTDSNTAGTAVNGDRLAIFVDGDDVVVEQNGVEILRRVGDTAYRAGLQPALYTNNANGALDDWTDGIPEVPDVVGETQAAGTTELEAAGFVVSVSTDYSDSVAVGLIISQDPAGGTFAASGSTVEIVVSLGPEPVVSAERPAGKPKKRKRLYVEIDGQSFDVDSYAEAKALLDRAKVTAQAVADDATDHAAKRTRRKKRAVVISKPVISTPFEELKPLVNEYREDIEAIYRQIAIDAETRELLRRKLAEQDDEEAIFVLLH